MARMSTITRAILAGVSVSALCVATPIIAPSLTPAAAQTRVAIAIEFRTALSPYGSWRSVPRWGEVWIPANVGRNWQPYTVGHWVYSEDYGWFWVSDTEEAEWGWVAYHYGRWAHDDSIGWFWLPGNEWGPAWVDWRRGDEYVGWAPLPPEEIIVEYRADPRFWLFVRSAQLIAPRIHTVILPLEQRRAVIQRTVVVNRTLVPSGRRFAVNPGIAPAIIAAAARQPVSTFAVRPHVIAGTADVRGAIEVRADDLRRGGNRPGRSIAQQAVVQQQVTTVQPARNVPAPQASERGQLGDSPPRAAAGAQERGTTGAPGATPPNQRDSATPRDERERTQDRGRAGAPAATSPSQQREGASPREERGTTGSTPPRGAAPREERANPNSAPQAPQREDASPREGRGSLNAPPPAQRVPPPRQEERQIPHPQTQAPQRQAPAAQVAPPAPPAAQAPAAAPSAPPKASAPPARQDEKREDKK